MSLVSHFSDRLAVMYAGAVVEFGPTRKVFDGSLRPYTQGLLEAFPSVYGPKVPLEGIPGAPPNLAHLPEGCRFHPRCPKVMPQCYVSRPELYNVEGQLVRCFLHQDGFARHA
jgi:peptide/nickel transport system ATP-binding protein